MNSREKLNAFWITAAVLVGLVVIVINPVGNGLILLMVIAGVIAWAIGNRRIR